MKNILLKNLLIESVESDLSNLKTANIYYKFLLNNIKKLKYKDWTKNKENKSYTSLIPLFKDLPKSLSTAVILNFKDEKTSFFKMNLNAIVFEIYYKNIGMIMSNTLNSSNYDFILKLIEGWLITNKNTIIHEFTHFLDNLKYQKPQKGTNFILKTKGIIAYYNTPAEYNAYTLSLINDLNSNINWFLKNMKTPERFIKKYGDNNFKNFINANPEIWKFQSKLNEKYRKHFLKRLYLHYQNWMKLWKKKKNELEDELKNNDH